MTIFGHSKFIIVFLRKIVRKKIGMAIFGHSKFMSWSQFGHVCRCGVIFKKTGYWFSHTHFEASYWF